MTVKIEIIYHKYNEFESDEDESTYYVPKSDDSPDHMEFDSIDEANEYIKMLDERIYGHGGLVELRHGEYAPPDYKAVYTQD